MLICTRDCEVDRGLWERVGELSFIVTFPDRVKIQIKTYISIMPGFSSSSKRFGLNFQRDSQKIPLLDTYGSVPKPGMTMPQLPTGENASVIVVEVGENKVYITDLKGAREILNDTKNTSWSPIVGPQGSYIQSYRDDTLALIMSDEDHNSVEGNGYTVKPIPGRKGLVTPSREYSILEDFLRRIQNFPFGDPDGQKNIWRVRIPLIITGSLLLLCMLLAFVWVMKFRGGFQAETISQFNYHPIFMIAGFMIFSGFSMLFYRTLTWYDKLTVKLLHTAFHLFSIVCIAIGYTAAQTSMAIAIPNKPSFCSLHSLLGLVTVVLFGLQFALGFGSFIMAYFLCETRSSSWRAAILPNHVTLGLTTFVMAAATAVTGLTEKAIFTLQDAYILGQSGESVYVNALGLCITAAAIAFTSVCLDPNIVTQSHDYGGLQFSPAAQSTLLQEQP
ncbi:unnamed protein product [Allacma fusca]|uniref:Cytochrome b561 domain-containing protein n=1 Tax=Allacma fusca TaxID=39272 RepID=A0A8J2NY83_9HEXA|nr:unnamed protein product [Allacma fusca]